MTHLSLLITVSCLLVSVCYALPVAVQDTSYPTIKALDKPAYLGRWYNAFVNTARFNGSCIDAYYAAVEGHSDAISLVNMGDYTSFGKGRTDGFAVQSPDASKPGYFDVRQGPGPDGPPPSQPYPYSTPNYIIMELGPIVEGLYDYSLITSPDGTLFVITRDMKRFGEKYQSDVLAKLAKWGFTNIVATPQAGCTYKPPTRNPYIKAIDKPAYLGRWYSAFVNTVRFNGSCITGDYKAVAGHSDAIAIHNQGQYTQFGNGSTTGFAIQSPSEPGFFDVRQGPGPDGPPPSQPYPYRNGNYLIMELGPIVKGLYDYSLITSSDGTLFVITRDMVRFHEKYEVAVVEKLAKWGFTSVVATPQAGCTYPPP